MFGLNKDFLHRECHEEKGLWQSWRGLPCGMGSSVGFGDSNTRGLSRTWHLV